LEPRTASSITRVFIGATIGCFVFFAIGCPAGCAIGWRIAFHENDGGSETLYSINKPTSQHAEFWVFLYDDLDHTTLQQVNRPDFEAPPGHRFIPSNETDATLGPWRGPGPPTYLNGTIPGGEHNYQAGGVTFTPIGGTTRAELILYPQKRQDGWMREYYTYDVSGSHALLIEGKRERSFNEWGIEMLAMYALLITAPAVILGVLIGGVIGSLPPRRNHMHPHR
tara:strand:- start:16017 stop:16688 length:672 start_codon:yes stop_codon:yes gene_type:complete